jgi:hypothetical protein
VEEQIVSLTLSLVGSEEKFTCSVLHGESRIRQTSYGLTEEQVSSYLREKGLSDTEVLAKIAAAREHQVKSRTLKIKRNTGAAAPFEDSGFGNQP